jgi:hypothetical protein
MFIDQLSVYRVGIICGARATLWNVDEKYDRVVATVRRMPTVRGIPWFDGTRIFSQVELKNENGMFWHMSNSYYKQTISVGADKTKDIWWPGNATKFVELILTYL